MRDVIPKQDGSGRVLLKCLHVFTGWRSGAGGVGFASRASQTVKLKQQQQVYLSSTITFYA